MARMSIIAKIVLVVLILSGLAGAILVVYAGQPLPLLNTVVTVPLLEESPTAVMTRMSESMNAVTTAQYALDIDIHSTPIASNIKINYDGQIVPSFVGVLEVGTEMEFGAFHLYTTFDGRLTDDMAYITISEPPAIPFIQLDVNAGTWYRFPNHSSQLELENFFSMYGVTGKIRRQADATVHGITTYHYVTTVDFGEWAALLQTPLTTPRHAVADVELWIGKRDYRLYQFRVLSDQADITLVVSDYGEAVTVLEPLNTKPIEALPVELLTQTGLLDVPLFAPLMGIDIGDGARDDDGDLLFNFWENLLGTDSTLADTDGDGFDDYQELIHGYNPAGEGRLLPLPMNSPDST